MEGFLNTCEEFVVKQKYRYDVTVTINIFTPCPNFVRAEFDA